MLTLDNLTAGKPVTTTLDVADDKLKVTYNPAVITGELVQEAQAAAARGPAEAFAESCRQLSLMLMDWDLLERAPKKGEKKADVPRYPTTPEALAKLPVGFVNEVIVKLSGDARPPEGGSFDGG